MTLHQFQSPNSAVVARPTGRGRFQTVVALRGQPIFADEPAEAGGDGTGPTPYELLSAALAACTAMTMRLYASRKGWTLPPFSVEVAHSLIPGLADGTPPRDHFSRHIALEGPLEPDRQAKLIEIADKCPVHRTLARGFEVTTDIGPPSEHPIAEPAVQHAKDMEQACRE